MNSRLDKMLQEYLVYDAASMREYKNLSEQLVTNLSRNMVQSAFNVILNRAEKLDYTIFERSMGNIEKVEGFADLNLCVNTMRSMQANNNLIEGLPIVEAAIKNLKDYRSDFEAAFKRENGIIKLTYVNACVALFSSVSYLIAVNVEYIKDGPNFTTMNLRNANKRKGIDSCMLRGLEQFNKLCLNGDMSRVITSTNKGPTLSEGITMAALGTMAISTLMMSTIAITATFGLISFLRFVVYQYFNMRVKISDYCRLQAQFLEMNSTKIGMMQNMTKTAARQATIASNLNKLADKIDVDQKVSTKKANFDMGSEDRNFNMSKAAYDDNIF